MKKTLLAIALVGAAVSTQAKTGVFGEADAMFLLNNSQAGSYATVSGWGTEFGFKGEEDLGEGEQAYFKMAFNPNLLFSNAPALSEGYIGLQGSYGKVELFFDETPLGQLNNEYFIFDNTPDSIAAILGVNQANAETVAVGDARLDGLRYISNELSGGLTLEAAVIPQEALNGQTGFSVAGHYSADAVRISGAFEVNAEINDNQLFRINGDVKTGNLTLGGTFQVGSNSAADTSASHIAGYVKLPLTMSGRESNIRVLAAFNTVTDVADVKVSEMYTSMVQDIKLSEKVSTYTFLNIYMENDMQDTTTSGGGGLKIRF